MPLRKNALFHRHLARAPKIARYHLGGIEPVKMRNSAMAKMASDRGSRRSLYSHCGRHPARAGRYTGGGSGRIRRVIFFLELEAQHFQQERCADTEQNQSAHGFEST